MADQPTRRGRVAVTRIVDAACELFLRQGIRATTLDQVGAASGVGRGQLYHYFGSKAGLVAAVVRQQVERTVGANVAALDNIATLEDLRTVGGAVAEHYAQPSQPLRCPLGALVNEIDSGYDDAKAILAAGFDTWQQAWARTLTRLQAAGVLGPEVNPGHAAAALLATYQGAIVMAAVHDDPAVVQISLDAALHNLMLPAA